MISNMKHMLTEEAVVLCNAYTWKTSHACLLLIKEQAQSKECFAWKGVITTLYVKQFAGLSALLYK